MFYSIFKIINFKMETETETEITMQKILILLGLIIVKTLLKFVKLKI